MDEVGYVGSQASKYQLKSCENMCEVTVKVFFIQCVGKSKWFRFRNILLEMRFASSVTAETVDAGESVNEADTPSLCIELIHLIKVVCPSLYPGRAL